MKAEAEGLVRGQEQGKLRWREGDYGGAIQHGCTPEPSRSACSLAGAEKPELGGGLPREMPAKRWSPVMRQ